MARGTVVIQTTDTNKIIVGGAFIKFLGKFRDGMRHLLPRLGVINNHGLPLANIE